MQTSIIPNQSGPITIYRIRNTVTGWAYVGSTGATVKSRWQDHLNRLRRGAHHSPHFQASWNKHGESVFVFEAVTTCSDTDRQATEQLLIDSGQTYNAMKRVKYIPPLNTWDRRCTKGEASPMAVLTADDVKAMRQMWLEGVSLYGVADAYGIGRRHAYGVCMGLSWKHVPVPDYSGRPDPHRGEGARAPRLIACIRKRLRCGDDIHWIASDTGVSVHRVKKAIIGHRACSVRQLKITYSEAILAEMGHDEWRAWKTANPGVIWPSRTKATTDKPFGARQVEHWRQLIAILHQPSAQR